MSAVETVLSRAHVYPHFCTMNIAEALEIIESGKVFSLLYVPFDKKKKSGGGKRFREELMITIPRKERDSEKAKNFAPQNHKTNSTRNFYKCISGEPTAAVLTVHIFLILEVNGEKVML